MMLGTGVVGHAEIMTFNDIVHNLRFYENSLTITYESDIPDDAKVWLYWDDMNTTSPIAEMSMYWGGRSRVKMCSPSISVSINSFFWSKEETVIRLPMSCVGHDLIIYAEWRDLKGCRTVHIPDYCSFDLDFCTRTAYSSIEATARYRLKWNHPDWWNPQESFSGPDGTVFLDVLNGPVTLTQGEDYTIEDVDGEGCTLVFPDLRRIGDNTQNSLALTAKLAYRSGTKILKSSSIDFTCKRPPIFSMPLLMHMNKTTRQVKASVQVDARSTEEGLDNAVNGMHGYDNGYVCLLRDGQIVSYKLFGSSDMDIEKNSGQCYIKSTFELTDDCAEDGKKYVYSCAYSVDEPKLDSTIYDTHDSGSAFNIKYSNEIISPSIEVYKLADEQLPGGLAAKAQKISWQSDYIGDSDLYYRLTVDGHQLPMFTFCGSDKEKVWYHVPTGTKMPEGSRYMEGDDMDELHNHTYLLEAFVHENDENPYSAYEWRSVGTHQLVDLTDVSASTGEYTDRVCLRAKATPLENPAEVPGFAIYRRNVSQQAGEFVRIGEQENNGRDLYFFDDQVDPGMRYEYRIEAYMPSEDHIRYSKFVEGSARLLGTITGNVSLSGAALQGVGVRLELVENQNEDVMLLSDSISKFQTVTDKNGNYIIRDVPIVGSGISYRIVPSMGDHQFEPADETRVVSKTTQVAQGADFKDNSTFPFYLHVSYEGTDIPVDSVQVYIDGTLVQASISDADISADMDPNAASNAAVICTDKNGFLKIDVPAGKHSLQLQRKGHVFADDGYWHPAGTELPKDYICNFDGQVGSQYSPVEFVDKTKVILAGKVVGGKVQARKPWGQSVANIGEARLRVRLADQRYKLNISDKSVEVDTLREVVSCQATVPQKSDSIIINTNAGTGEFYVAVPPVDFIVEEVRQVDGSLCSSTTTGQKDFGNVGGVVVKLDAQKVVNKLTRTDGTEYPIHGGFAITYHAPKQVEMWDKSSYCGRGTGLFGDAVYEYDGVKYDLFIDNERHAFGKPVFTTRTQYEFGIRVYETYKRPTDGPMEADVVPVAYDSIVMVNGMGSMIVSKDYADVQGTGNSVVKLDSLGEATYRWSAGFPKFADDHVLRLAVRDEDTGEYIDTLAGYVMGDIPVPGSNFVTWPRQAVTDVIHDPYGSGSYAWRESNFSTMSLHTEKKRTIEHDNMLHDNAGALMSPEFNTAAASITFDLAVLFGQERVEKEQSITSNSVQVDIAQTEKITTSAEVSGVGPDADIFTGYAMNSIISDANGLWLKPKDGVTPQGITDFAFKKEKCKTASTVLGTNFVYTRQFIRTVQIPALKENIMNILTKAEYMKREDFQAREEELRSNVMDEPKYITFYTPDEEGFATNLDVLYEQDKTNSSYVCLLPKKGTFEDMVFAYQNGIDCWESAMEQDEKNQAEFFNNKDKKVEGDDKNKIKYENTSISRGTSVERSISTSTTEGCSSEYTYDYKKYITIDGKVQLFVVGTTLRHKWLDDDDYENRYDEDGKTRQTTWGCVLKENNEGNFLSQDVVEPATGTHNSGSYMFFLRGGQTENPHQKALETRYYKENGLAVKVGEDTQNLGVPVLNIKNGEGVQKSITYNNLRIGQPVYVTLQLNSLSPQNYKPENYLLGVPATMQTHGLALTVGGTNIRHKQVPCVMYQNQPMEVTLLITPTSMDTLDYENVEVRLYADGWDKWTTYDKVSISLHYTPSAGDVAVNSPSTVVSTKTDSKLNLVVSDYDRKLYGFACIDLMYRKVGEPQFRNTFARFWKDEATSKMSQVDKIPFLGDKSQAHFGMVDQQNTLYYAFDMSNQSLYEDGDYEIQAVCRALFVDTVLNKTTVCENPSEVWRIRKDTTRPEILGKTIPVDGILTPDTEIGLNFTEDVDPRYIVKDSISLVGRNYTGKIDFDYTISDRKLVIKPKVNRSSIDGDELTVTVKGIRDMAGNNMAQDASWKVKVDWLPLRWEAPIFYTSNGAELRYMQSDPVTVKVKNHSSRQQYFWIQSKPKWLAVSPMDGTVGPFGEFEVTLLANDRLPLGMNNDTPVTMGVDQDGDSTAYTASLDVCFTVIGNAPDWEPANPNTEDNMSVLLNVSMPFGALFQSDDVIAAFCGDECVGVTTYMRNLERSVAAMTIHRPKTIDEEITFKVWDSHHDVIYDKLVPEKPLKFTPDTIYGTVDKPFTLKTGSSVLRYVDIARGYSWLSLGVDTKDQLAANIFAPLNGPDADTVTVKTYSYFLTSRHGMATGSLVNKRIAPQEMVSVFSANDPAVLEVKGSYVNTDNLLYDIKGYNNRPTKERKTYWTWISYPLPRPLDVKYALCRLDAVDGDVIKGHRQFAMYQDGKWHGSLEILCPGYGYKFGSLNAEDREMYYSAKGYKQYLEAPTIETTAETNVRSRKMVSRAKGSEELMWTPTNGYSDNMCVRAIVMDGEEQMTTGQVGGFDAKDECRGAEFISEDGCVYLTLSGEAAGEPILFRYCDDAGVVREGIATLPYTSDGMIGLFGDPYIIQLNPEFAAMATVECADGCRIIATYDVSGRRIATGSVPLNTVVINLVECPDGSVKHVKMMNKQIVK